MRFYAFIFAAFVLLSTIDAASKKVTFDNKMKKLVTTFLGTNIAAATTMVNDLLVNQTTFADITTVLMNNMLTFVPSNKYLTGLSMLTTFQSCLSKTGTNMTAGMEKIGTAVKSILNAPYTKIINKMKAMKKAKKPTANMQNQAYTIATSVLTKVLVQKIIDKCKKQATAAEYSCAQGPLTTILVTGYVLDYSKTG